MIKKRFLTFLFLFVTCLCLQPLFAASNKSKTMYISLSPAKLMAKPSQKSALVSNLDYGTKVLILEEKGNWILVCLEEKESVKGWIPSGAVTSKKITKKNTASTANAEEIALAGKGFSSSIEKEYAKDYEINFKDVDFVEAQAVSSAKTEAFIVEGELNTGDE